MPRQPPAAAAQRRVHNPHPTAHAPLPSKPHTPCHAPHAEQAPSVPQMETPHSATTAPLRDTDEGPPRQRPTRDKRSHTTLCAMDATSATPQPPWPWRARCLSDLTASQSHRKMQSKASLITLVPVAPHQEMLYLELPQDLPPHPTPHPRSRRTDRHLTQVRHPPPVTRTKPILRLVTAHYLSTFTNNSITPPRPSSVQDQDRYDFCHELGKVY